MNLHLEPEVLSGLVVLVVFVVPNILLISMVWPCIFKKLGIGKPQKCLLSLKRKRNDEMIFLLLPMCIFKTALESTAKELESKGMSIFCIKMDEDSYVIKKSCSKLAMLFGHTFQCYVKGSFKGMVQLSLFNKVEFNEYLIEGNNFISHKKAQENKEFITTFVECLKKNLTQIENPLADEVEIINCNN
ncbi:hypothetical protein II582_01985 [bacterium]|nr:hypothetical protein [bacterium]